MIPIDYYAKFEYCTDSKKTPKYSVTASTGYYPPMETLRATRGKGKGKISVYLMPTREPKPNEPPMYLQARDSLNLTGLFMWFDGGQLTGYAFGYPLDKKQYGGKHPRENPFYNYREDAFLFFTSDTNKNTLPISFEMIVLHDAKVQAPAFLKNATNGRF
jgi:hypothetical protein